MIYFCYFQEHLFDIHTSEIPNKHHNLYYKHLKTWWRTALDSWWHQVCGGCPASVLAAGGCQGPAPAVPVALPAPVPYSLADKCPDGHLLDQVETLWMKTRLRKVLFRYQWYCWFYMVKQGWIWISKNVACGSINHSLYPIIDIHI